MTSVRATSEPLHGAQHLSRTRIHPPVAAREACTLQARSHERVHRNAALSTATTVAVLAHLVGHRMGGRFRLIYADPPYNSGVEWTRGCGGAGQMHRSADAVLEQQPQYADAWDESAYLQFLYERLPLLRDLLADDGSLWLHCDHRHAHHLRCLLEEVFGAQELPQHDHLAQPDAARGQGQCLLLCQQRPRHPRLCQGSQRAHLLDAGQEDADPERGAGRRRIHARRERLLPHLRPRHLFL